ncbi:MAG: M48 family metallopeptidase [Kosmotogaceae bacterium]
MKVQSEGIVFVFQILFYSIIIFDRLFNLFIEFLNFNHTKKKNIILPEKIRDEFSDAYLKKSKEYNTEKLEFSIFSGIIDFLLLMILIVFGFRYFESISADLFEDEIIGGIFFVFLIWVIFRVINFAFSLYQSFAIEKKYGFSNTTYKLFLMDQLKITAFSILLGTVILAGIFWSLYNIEQWWIVFIAGFIVINLFINWIYPAIVIPIFNKLKPLEDPELKEKINEIADYAGFKTKGIFVLDASRRTSHSNAMFAGIGNTKRIILYDTLLENNTHEEIEAIFAHEAGHYVNKDIVKGLLLSIVIFSALVILLWYLISNDLVSSAYDLNKYYTEFIYSSVLIGSILSFARVILNSLSRKREYKADLYAVRYVKDPDIVIEALKKLHKSNLSNLNPHPFYVKFNYSHPTLMQRIEHLENPKS